MATTSFGKNFVVRDQNSINKLQSDFANPRKVKTTTRNIEAENAKGIKLLKQRLSNLAHC